MYILLVPVLLFLLCFLMLLSFCLGKWKVGLILLVLLIALDQHTQNIPVNVFHSSTWEQPDSASLTLMTYNTALNASAELQTYIDTVNADVVCLQESCLNDSSILLQKYPWHAGNLVFSRYRILSHQVLSVAEGTPGFEELVNDSLNPDNKIQYGAHIHALELELPGDTVELVSCHLHSNTYSNVRRSMGSDQHWSDGLGLYYDHIAFGYKARKVQAGVIREFLDTLPAGRPVIVCGDLNDLSGSYALNTIQGERLSDAWWTGGLGPGFTYNGFHLLLRLDHVLYSPEFELRQVLVDDQAPYSDHYPLRVELKLPSKK